MPDFWAIAILSDTPISIDSRKGRESIAQTPLHSNNSNCWNSLRVPRLSHQGG
jgi:hypothetical protein